MVIYKLNFTFKFVKTGKNFNYLEISTKDSAVKLTSSKSKNSKYYAFLDKKYFYKQRHYNWVLSLL